jgi:hypothetical protein
MAVGLRPLKKPATALACEPLSPALRLWNPASHLKTATEGATLSSLYN